MCWGLIFKTLSVIFKKAVQHDPMKAILGMVGIKTEKPSGNKILFFLLLAGRLILLRWKTENEDEDIHRVMQQLKEGVLCFPIFETLK